MRYLFHDESYRDCFLDKNNKELHPGMAVKISSGKQGTIQYCRWGYSKGIMPLAMVEFDDGTGNELATDALEIITKNIAVGETTK